MATIIFTSQPTTLSVVPNQNTTLSVEVSADFDVVSYTYQWKKSATAGGLIGSAQILNGATNSAYFFEPKSGDNGYKYYCTVNALSAGEEGPESVASVDSTGLTLTVVSEVETGEFHKWVPFNDANSLNETGYERFLRMRHLGYC